MDPWHFLETVNRTNMLFDYRIRAGVSSAPNALRLLERMNYPSEVVRRAYDAYGASTMSNSKELDATGFQPGTQE